MELSFAKALCSDPQSGFSLMTAEEIISLAPCFQTSISQGIRQHLDTRIGFVCDKFEGVIMGYSKVRLKGDLGRVIDDMPYINVGVVVDFIIFQPRVGTVLQGVVNKIGKDHLGLVVHGLFNVSLHLSGEQPSTPLAKGDNCSFVITRVHTHRGLLSMVGKMVAVDGQ